MRRDSGQSYDGFLTDLAKSSGTETPTREDLAKVDKTRKNKASNQDWYNPHDPDARITKMKDGTTHLAYKAEHAVDMEAGAVVAVTLQAADQGDTMTVHETLAAAGDQLLAVAQDLQTASRIDEQLLAKVVNGKGYHSSPMLKVLAKMEIRSYVGEPLRRGRRNWDGKQEEREAVNANRERISSEYGRLLLSSNAQFIAEEITAGRADVVYVCEDAELEDFRDEPHTQAICEAVCHFRPLTVPFGATSTGRSLAPRVAVRLKTGLTADCTELEAVKDGLLYQTRPAFGDNIMATIVCRRASPQMATVRPHVMKRLPPNPERKGAVDWSPSAPLLSRTRLLRFVPEDGQAVNIEDAQVVLVGSRLTPKAPGSRLTPTAPVTSSWSSGKQKRHGIILPSRSSSYEWCRERGLGRNVCKISCSRRAVSSS